MKWYKPIFHETYQFCVLTFSENKFIFSFIIWIAKFLYFVHRSAFIWWRGLNSNDLLLLLVNWEFLYTTIQWSILDFNWFPFESKLHENDVVLQYFYSVWSCWNSQDIYDLKIIICAFRNFQWAFCYFM